DEWVGHFQLGQGYEATGKQLEAAFEFQKAVELSGGNRTALAALAHAYAAAGKKAEAEKILRELEAVEKRGGGAPCRIASIYAGLGEREKAFEFLAKAFRERALEVSWEIKADYRMDGLRGDGRFREFVREVGFGE